VGQSGKHVEKVAALPVLQPSDRWLMHRAAPRATTGAPSSVQFQLFLRLVQRREPRRLTVGDAVSTLSRCFARVFKI